MTRQALCLYDLDRPALKKVSTQLEHALLEDDRDAFAELLELGDAMSEDLTAHERLVDLFLLPEEHPTAKALFASLRRVSKKRALTKVMTSSDLALEGRLRGYDALRSIKPAAKLVDKLLNPKRLPWYLRVKDATCGWVDPEQLKELIGEMEPLRTSLTPELVEFLDGLGEITEHAVAHDSL
jgi:hypothetical protein